MPEAVEEATLCCCFKKPKPEMEALSQNNETSRKVALVPFSSDLPELSCGNVICIRGTVLPKCSRFAVNLTCGKTPSSDLAFHFNPRLLQKYIVRNSRLNGQWGPEEKTATVKFPFSRNSQFLLNILIGTGEFLVAVDGVHFCSYKFRIGWEKVTGLEVQGDVDVCGVEYKKVEKYPEVVDVAPEVKIIEGSEGNLMDLKTGMQTPVSYFLPNGLQKNLQLQIYGRVKILPHSFYINLQNGRHIWPHPKIHLHLNLRFGLGIGEPLFVRNAWIDNGWGQEERSPGFQFEPGSPFTIAIRMGEDRFCVAIDGKLVGEFKFRGGVEDIDTVLIDGDVVIFDVFYKKNF